MVRSASTSALSASIQAFGAVVVRPLAAPMADLGPTKYLCADELLNDTEVSFWLQESIVSEASPSVISHTYSRHLIAALLTLAAAASPAAAQGGLSQGGAGAPHLPAGSPFLGSVPQGTASPQPVAISIPDAIHRALQRNLGVL